MGLGRRRKNTPARESTAAAAKRTASAIPPDHTRNRRADFVLPSAEGQLGYPEDLLSATNGQSGNGQKAGTSAETSGKEPPEPSE